MYFEQPDQRRKLYVCFFLIAASFLVYGQVIHHDFIAFDDPSYITENHHVNTGLSPANILWAFTTAHAHNWHPLTWISHMTDVQLFGLNAGRHHLMNVFFHIANAVLLFLILQRMTRDLWPSAFVAALFALHPLHVESVAWASERKDVLSTFFWMLTMGSYVFYVEKPDTKKYLLTLGFFALGLMAKPMLVTLPFVLLLLDYWPLGRLQTMKPVIEPDKEISAIHLSKKQRKKMREQLKQPVPQMENPAAGKIQWAHIKPVLVEKIPFLALIVISSIMTLHAQQEIVKSLESYSLKIRMANAVNSYIQYIVKMIWPAKLVIFYPHPEDMLSLSVVAGTFGVLVAVTLLLLFKIKRPVLTVGWLWYLGTLVPVIGLVQVGLQSMADRYTYIPLIGLFIMLSWGFYSIFPAPGKQRSAMAVSALLILVILMGTSWNQTKYWRNSRTLFEHAAKSTENNWWAHYNLGLVQLRTGQREEAFLQFQQALRIKPSNADAYLNLGVIFSQEGKFDEAIRYFSKALEIRPKYADAQKNLGLAMMQKGDLDKATAYLGNLVNTNTPDPEILYIYGRVLSRTDHIDEALAVFSRALQMKPDFADVHNSMGVLFARKGKMDEAVSHFQQALRIRPQYREARHNLNAALSQKNSVR